jgi:hypothetical protein
VIVVVYEPQTDTAYWQHIDKNTIASTGEGWKVHVPRANSLDASAAGPLGVVADGDPYGKPPRLRRTPPVQRIRNFAGVMLADGRQHDLLDDGDADVALR